MGAAAQGGWSERKELAEIAEDLGMSRQSVLDWRNAMTILLIVVIAGVAAAAGYFFGKGAGRLEGFAQLAREIAKESTFVVDGMTGGRSDDYKNRLDALRLEYDTSRTLREWRNIPACTLYGIGFDEGKKVGHREATGGA